ncbi:MAG: hypothetical protein AAGA92_09200 [Planctomycetota bacterium]
MNGTKPVPEEHPHAELLSAYFDGRLAGEELAQAEQLLAGDASARRELASLRELSAEIKAMPRKAPTGDVTAAVLSRLQETKPRPASSDTVTQNVPRGWRSRVWAAAAIAAALLLMLLPSGDQGEPNNVAAVDPAESEWNQPAVPEGLRIVPISPEPLDLENSKPVFANPQRLGDGAKRVDLNLEIYCDAEADAREGFDRLIAKHNLKTLYRQSEQEQEASRPAGHRTAWVECEPAGLRALLEDFEALNGYQLGRSPEDILETPLPGLAHVMIRLVWEAPAD